MLKKQNRSYKKRDQIGNIYPEGDNLNITGERNSIKFASLAGVMIAGMFGLIGAIKILEVRAEVLQPDSNPTFPALTCEASSSELDWSSGVITSGTTISGRRENTAAESSLTFGLEDAVIQWTRSDGVVATGTVNTTQTTAPLGSGYFRPGTFLNEGVWVFYGPIPTNANSHPTYVPAAINNGDVYVWDISFSEPINDLVIGSQDIDGTGGEYNDASIITGYLGTNTVPATIYSGTNVAYSSIGANTHRFDQTLNANVPQSDPSVAALLHFDTQWVDKVTVEYDAFTSVATTMDGTAPGITLSLDEGCPPIGVSKDATSVTTNPNGTYSVQYTVNAKNTADVDLFDLQLTDALPYTQSDVISASLSPVSGLTAGDLNTSFDGYGNTEILAGGANSNFTLANTETISFTIDLVLQQNAAPGIYNNQVEVCGKISELGSQSVCDLSDDGVNPDPSDTNGSGGTDDPTPVSLILPAVDLELSKSISPIKNAYKIGETVTYQVSIVNQGARDATGVIAEDALPAGLSFVSAAADQGSYNSSTGEWSVGTIAIGNQANLSITATIVDGFTITNLAQIIATNETDIDSNPSEDENTDDLGDGNPDDDEDEVTITVHRPDIQLNKASTFNDENGDTYAQVGETISYTFVVTNTGNIVLTNVLINDPLIEVIGGPIAIMNPSDIDSSTFTGLYSLTQADIDRGYVENTAVVSGQDTLDETVEDTSDSNNPGGDESTETPDGEGSSDGDPTNDPTIEVLKQPVANLSGAVWNDLDEDGIIDTDEAPFNDVLVDLLDKDGNVIATTTTDSNGEYEFTNILIGEYRVRISPPEGYEQTYDNDGVETAHIIFGVILGSGDNKIDQNFGYVTDGLADTGSTVTYLGILVGISILAIATTLSSMKTTLRLKR